MLRVLPDRGGGEVTPAAGRCGAGGRESAGRLAQQEEVAQLLDAAQPLARARRVEEQVAPLGRVVQVFDAHLRRAIRCSEAGTLAIGTDSASTDDERRASACCIYRCRSHTLATNIEAK